VIALGDMIEELTKQIPSELLPRSGKVFYSGRLAFSAPSEIYVLGVNPGGDPTKHEFETVGSHTDAVLHSYPDDWSAYRDESWNANKAPGSFGMAPRVLHLFSALGFNPGQVPCSNLVFVRSRREEDMKDVMAMLTDRCWPFHQLAIERLRPKVILCFGKTAGKYVRNKVGAHTLYAEFVEANQRRWPSQAFSSRSGVRVVVATHPSIADWTTPSTDPTELIRNMLR
jgi:uracil-DNA glycosylase family 4